MLLGSYTLSPGSHVFGFKLIVRTLRYDVLNYQNLHADLRDPALILFSFPLILSMLHLLDTTLLN